MKLILSIFTLSTLFSVQVIAACRGSSICKGDRVNFGDYVGTAKEVFTNGRVKIDVDGYTGYSYRTTSQLGKGVKCYNGICKYNRVNFGDYVGTAKEVFTNGRVKIDVDGYTGYSYRTTSQLGRGYRCIENLCKGDRVNFGDYVGTAKEVFTNSRVKIDVDGYTGYSYRTTRELGYEISCSSNGSYNDCHCRE